MEDIITKEQRKLYARFKEYVSANVAPHAALWDKEERISRAVLEDTASNGFLGAVIPEAYSGQGWDYATYALMNEAFGRASSSLTSLFTVQAMVSTALMKWGDQKLINKWLEPMAKGDIIASFALTEPNTGSNIQNITTDFKAQGDSFLLNGTKKWITFAALADLYLVFGKSDGKSVACFVEKDMPGVEVRPLKGMIGFKGCHLAQLDFNDVVVPKTYMLGRPGLALSYIAPLGLHYGRLSTAFSSVGLMRACLETSSNYAMRRKVDGEILITKGEISEKIANMGVLYDAASLMCWQAVCAEDNLDPQAITKMIGAKYYAAQCVNTAAADTIQILGASGCHEITSPAGRYFRDAKIMEIIEGTHQVLSKVLGKDYANRYKQHSKKTAKNESSN